MTYKKDTDDLTKPYECRNRWCKKLFKTARTRWWHEKFNCIHPSKRFSCEECGEKFRTRKSLVMHQRGCYWLNYIKEGNSKSS